MALLNVARNRRIWRFYLLSLVGVWVPPSMHPSTGTEPQTAADLARHEGNDEVAALLAAAEARA